MIRTARLALLLAVLVATSRVWAFGQVATQGPANPGAPQIGSGFIAGQVVDATTGRPIPEAAVHLSGRSGAGRAGNAPSLVADNQGRFYFRSLLPGLYVLSGSSVGFSPRQPVQIEVANDERVLNVRLPLVRLATISGVVRDSSGDPVVGTEVLPFLRLYNSGRLSLTPATRGIKTDDRGMYRFSGLMPGEYLVCACVRDPIPIDQLLLNTLAAEPFNLMTLAARALSSGSDAVAIDDTLRGFAPTFYPATRSMAQATRITLAPGEQKTGVDITAELVRATRVSGRIVGAQSPMVASSVRLVPQADADAGIQLTAFQPMLMQADGRFDFANVPPGQYRLIVNHRETGGRGGGPSGLALGFTGGRANPPPSAPMAVGPGGPVTTPVLWANEVIVVGDRGLAGLNVALSEGLTVNGRIQFVGSAPQPTEQLLTRSSMALQELAPTGGGITFASGPVTAAGTFKAAGAVPGKYRASFSGVPGYANLKSVTLSGVEIMDLPIVIGAKDPGELVLTYVDTPAAALTVTAQVPPGRRGDDDMVLLFPADRRYWPDPAAGRRRFRTQQLSSKGVAVVADLPAGDYLVVLDQVQPYADWQESTLEALSRRAQRVTLGDGDKRTIEVRR